MTRGKLMPASPPGAALPAPHRTRVKLSPADFSYMWPARFVPDYYMNQAEGGVYYDITPFSYPITVPGGGSIRSVIFEMSKTFDEFTIQSFCQVQEIIAGVLQPPSRLLRVDALMRDLGAQEQLTDDFVSLFSVFGTGRYPHPFAMPLVLSAGSDFQVEVRNREANDVRVMLTLSAIKKNATRETIS